VIQRRAVVGVVFAISVSLLAACGFQAPDVEATEHAAVQATDFHVGAIQLGGTSITSVTPASGIPRFFLQVTIVNDGNQSETLTKVEPAAGSTGAITLSGPGTIGGLAIPPGVPVMIEVPSTSFFGPNLSVNVTPTPVVGAYVPVIFTFANQPPSQVVQVPVIPAGETTAPTQPVPTTQATAPAEVGDSASD
jgi:hypothetical protein